MCECVSNIRLCLIAWHAYVWIFSAFLCAVFQTPSPVPASANSLFINCILLHSKTKVLRRTTKTRSHSYIHIHAYSTQCTCSRREKNMNGRITPSTAAFSHYLQYLLCLSPVCYFSRVCLCSCMSVLCVYLSFSFSHTRSLSLSRDSIDYTHNTHIYIFFLIIVILLIGFRLFDSMLIRTCDSDNKRMK